MTRAYLLKLIGALTICLALAVPACGFFCCWLAGGPIESTAAGVSLVTLWLAGMFLGPWLYALGKRACHPPMTIAKLSAADPRPPVVYLRSFVTDGSFDVAIVGVRFFGTIFPTDEERLARCMEVVGPFVAIGRPGERLPHTGAHRVYMGRGEAWQDVVAGLVGRARLVVLNPLASGDGFWWEVTFALERVDPGRVLFYLPPRYKMDRHKPYRRFRDEFRARFGIDLPPIQDEDRFIRFGDDWTPALLRRANQGWFPRPWWLFVTPDWETHRLASALRQLFPTEFPTAGAPAGTLRRRLSLVRDVADRIAYAPRAVVFAALAVALPVVIVWQLIETWAGDKILFAYGVAMLLLAATGLFFLRADNHQSPSLARERRSFYWCVSLFVVVVTGGLYVIGQQIVSLFRG